jgi:hypothetical protein
MEKLDKKVTWKENLTDVKIMTPQTSVFHNLREIVFCEEDEETLDKDKVHLMHQNLNTSYISQTWKHNLNTTENNKDNENDEDKSKEDKSEYQNNKTFVKRNFEEERKQLDRSLVQIFANKD